ncbi:MAG: hypothetical protein K6D90_00215 [Lachnospiraceae bacterium]|nr:hypothetical protein [Lachnospiraceae bacterium]
MNGVKRLAAGFLCLAMILSYMPANVYAQEGSYSPDATVIEETLNAPEENVQEESKGLDAPAVEETLYAPEANEQENVQDEEVAQPDDQEQQIIEAESGETERLTSNEASEYKLMTMDQDTLRTSHWYYYTLGNGLRPESPEELVEYDVTDGEGRGNLIDNNGWYVAKNAKEIRFLVCIYEDEETDFKIKENGIDAQIGTNNAVCSILDSGRTGENNDKMRWYYCAVKYEDGTKEIDGDVTCTIHINPSYIVYNNYKFEYEITGNHTVVINKISKYNNDADGNLIIPATIDGLPVSGFAGGMLDEIKYNIKSIENQTQTDVGLILPEFYHDEYIWVNEYQQNEKVTLLKNGRARRREKYNYVLNFDTINLGTNDEPEGPGLQIEEVYTGVEPESSITGDYGDSVIRNGGFYAEKWFSEKPEKNQTTVGINIYLDKKYDPLLKEFKVKRYKNYPETRSFAVTDKWDELKPNATEELDDGRVKYTFDFGDDAEKYSDKEYALGIEVKYEDRETYFVDFNTGGSSEVAIVPDGGDFIPNPNFNDQHGVYVYAGGTLSFHFKVNKGTRVTDVTQGQGKNGVELTADGLDSASRDDLTIKTGSFETGLINANTTIYVGSEEKPAHFVSFVTNSDKIACVPDGGVFIANPNFNTEHGILVYDEETLSFHFRVEDGYGIRKVTQGTGGPELITAGSDLYEEGFYETGSYTTGEIDDNTEIIVENGATVALSWSNDPDSADYKNAEIYLLDNSFKAEYEKALQNHEEWVADPDKEETDYVWPTFKPEEYRLNGDHFALTPGVTYYIEVIPAYGYQIGGTYGADGTIIGETKFTPTVASTAYGVWSFTANASATLNDIVKKIAGTEGYAANGNPALSISHSRDAQNEEIKKIKDAEMVLEKGDNSDFSCLAARGGTLLAKIEDGRQSRLPAGAVEAPYTTFSFNLLGERWKGITGEGDSPWGFYDPSEPDGAFPELVKVTLTLNDDAQADNYKLFWERQEGDKYYPTVWGSHYDKAAKTLTFSTNISGTFSIVPADDVLFDFGKVLDYQEDGPDKRENLSIKPAEEGSGLIPVPEEENRYRYCGYGPIRLQVLDNDLPIRNLSRLKDGFHGQYLLNMFAGKKDGEGENAEEVPFAFLIEDDGTVEIPAVDYEAWDPEYYTPITNMITYAEEKEQDNVIYVTANWNNKARPAAQMILNDEFADYSNWSVKAFEGDEYQPGEPYTTNDEENHYYLNGDVESFRFQLKGKAGYQLDSVAYRAINWYDNEQGILRYEPAPGYIGLTKLEPQHDDVLNVDYYEITVPQPHGHIEKDEGDNDIWVTDDWGVNLGVEIIPQFTQLATVEVQLKGANNTVMDSQYLNASVRIDAAAYEVKALIPDGAERYAYVSSVPKDSTVTVTLTSPDGLWAVSGVKLTDAKNTNKVLKASKNGEYTLTVADKGVLEVTIEPVTKLVVEKVTSEGGIPQYTALQDLKNVYSLKTRQKFRAYLANGSNLVGATLVANKVQDVTFFNGKKEIVSANLDDDEEANDIRVENDELITTGEALGLAKLSLKATLGKKAYTATLNYTGSTVVVTSPKPEEGALVLPYGQKATVKVNIGGNLKGVTAWIREYDGENDTFNKIDPDGNFALLGSFDGKTITIDPKKATKHLQAYKPNTWLELCFFDANGNKIDEGFYSVYSLYFTAPEIAGKDAPTVTANASLSTNRAVGLTLSLPRGVKAVDGMYYKIEADAVVSDEEEDVFYNSEHNKYYKNLANYDAENDQVNSVYKQNVVDYVPATEKSWALDVSDDPWNDEDGWIVTYNVKATLVYIDENKQIIKFAEEGPEQKTETSEEKPASTKGNMFETKLSLTKKMPAKIYNRQNSIPLAVPKWSKSATVQKLDRVELVNEYGNVYANWNRWGDRNLLDVDETGLITLDTQYDDGNYISAGKFTLVAYAVGGPGAQASATIPVTILESIQSLSVSAPARVLKNYNKAATVKADVAYNVNERENTPATKSVEWSLAVAGVTPGTYQEIPEDSPLYGKLTMKNGTVTIDKSLMVDLTKSADDYTFYISAKAADYAENNVWSYSEPIRITSESQVPTEFQFYWDEYEWDEENKVDVFVRRSFSNITETEIVRKEQAKRNKDIYMEPFYSGAIQFAKVLVLDQYGDQMYATLKLKGISQRENGELILSKAGKVSITATAVDGSKKSKKIEFTIADGDVRFTPNVLIQQESQFYRDRDREFINTYNRWEEAGEDSCWNDGPGNKYVYVHVGAVRYADLGEENGDPAVYYWDRPNYGDIVMFNHVVKVKGGTIKATLTGEMDKYTTYVILPTAEETVVTLTDNTMDKKFGRAKGTYEYTIHNNQISDNKARKITADKKSISNWMWTDWYGYATSPENPNYVTYTISNYENRPRTQYYVRITMDELTTGAMHNLARALYMPDNDEEYHAFNAEVEQLLDDEYYQKVEEINAKDDIDDEEKERMIRHEREPYINKVEEEYFRKFEEEGIMRPVKNGKFSIGFFSPREDEWDGGTYCDFSETPAGTYNYYVTYGYLEEGSFIPLEKSTKMSVKLAAAPVPAVKYDATKLNYSLSADQSKIQNVLIKSTVTKGRGLKLDPENDFCYETVSVNSNGVTNDFRNLFHVEVETTTGSTNILRNENALLVPHGYLDCWIPLSNGSHVRIERWEDLKGLKDGTFYVRGGEDTRWYGNPEEDDVHLIGTVNEQQNAYKAWIKTNGSGILRCFTVGYDGRERQVDTKVTVDLDFLVEHFDLL